jgi:hypothetical protein
VGRNLLGARARKNEHIIWRGIPPERERKDAREARCRRELKCRNKEEEK